MSDFQIRILPFDRQIECRSHQTILRAILEQGCYLRYGCKNGGCGSCKVQLVEGAVEQGGSSLALSPSERSEGYALICTAMPLSDCTLDASAMELTEDEFASGDRTGAFLAEVEFKEALAPDIRRLYLRLVEPDSIRFTAGQFVNAEVPESRQLRAYSMANPPSDRHHVELIVKLLPHGIFSSYLEFKLKVGDRLRLCGPLGRLKCVFRTVQFWRSPVAPAWRPCFRCWPTWQKKATRARSPSCLAQGGDRTSIFKTVSNPFASRCRHWKRSWRCRRSSPKAGRVRRVW
jgi:Na+-transporting NADH:ubiquinone oxidoreductase subunit NqrF